MGSQWRGWSGSCFTARRLMWISWQEGVFGFGGCWDWGIDWRSLSYRYRALALVGGRTGQLQRSCFTAPIVDGAFWGVHSFCHPQVCGRYRLPTLHLSGTAPRLRVACALGALAHVSAVSLFFCLHRSGTIHAPLCCCTFILLVDPAFSIFGERGRL